MEDYLKRRDMRIVVKVEKPEQMEVKIGMLQESVLAPLMLLDARLLKKIRNFKDCEVLQNDKQGK